MGSASAGGASGAMGMGMGTGMAMSMDGLLGREASQGEILGPRTRRGGGPPQFRGGPPFRAPTGRGFRMNPDDDPAAMFDFDDDDDDEDGDDGDAFERHAEDDRGREAEETMADVLAAAVGRGPSSARGVQVVGSFHEHAQAMRASPLAASASFATQDELVRHVARGGEVELEPEDDDTFQR